jgi:hypothetical protein
MKSGKSSITSTVITAAAKMLKLSRRPPPLPNGILDDDNILRDILSYVGEDQYRFVATVNRNFRNTYVSLYPDKTTFLNVSTMGHATICCQEICDREYSHCEERYRFILCKNATKMGDLSILKFLYSNDCPLYYHYHQWFTEYMLITDTFKVAVKSGHVHILQWMKKLEEYSYMTKSSSGHEMKWAARHGQLDALKWLHANGFKWGQRNLYNVAAERGHLPVLQWLLDNNCPCEADDDNDEFTWTVLPVLLIHCQYNALECVLVNGKWMNQDIDIDKYSTKSIQILLWLHKNFPVCDKSSVEQAMEHIKRYYKDDDYMDDI